MRKIFNLFLALVVSLVCVPGYSQDGGGHSQSKARPFTRPSSNPSFTGIIIVKPLDDKNDALFFRAVQPDGSTKDYLVDQNCDKDCRKAIEACKGGEKCKIRGKVDESALSITPEKVTFDTATAPIGETKTSKKADGTEGTWTRDRSHPMLGEAWRDPSGMIWGDMVTKPDGTPKKMTHKAAIKYCEDIGARLPSKDDFIRLSEYMGAYPGNDDGKGYRPQVLPHLSNDAFWSSSEPINRSNRAYVFYGRSGNMFDGGHRDLPDYSVRCVARR